MHLAKRYRDGLLKVYCGGYYPGWPLENPPPVAGSKSPTLRLAERGFI